MTSLNRLIVAENLVKDLTPIVLNENLGDDSHFSYVNVRYNPVDCVEQEENIRALIDRGVKLEIDYPTD